MLTGEELLAEEQQINGFRVEAVYARDPDNHLVFRAVDQHRNRTTIKVVPTPHIQNRKAAVDQALSLMSISHPNIAKLSEFMICSQNKQVLIFGEYWQYSLGRCFSRLREEQISQIALQIAQSVFYLHDKCQIAHGCICMESVQLESSHLQFAQVASKLSFYCVQDSDVESLMYMAPKFSDSCDFQSDIWQLGLLLLELFSRKRLHLMLPQLKVRSVPVFRIHKLYCQETFSNVTNQSVKSIIQAILLRPTTLKMSEIVGKLREALVCESGPVLEQSGHRLRADNLNNDQLLTIRSSEGIPSDKKQKQWQQSTDAFAALCSRSPTQRKQTTWIALNEMSICRIEPIRGFPSLTWIQLENNLITRIENMDYPNLKGLNLGRNKITRIGGLHKLECLQELYLYTNAISKIQGLQSLSNLSRLYLTGNQIRKIENLWNLPSLVHFSIRSNLIDRFEPDNVTALNALKLMKVQVSL